MDSDYDAVVAGGGPAGLQFARDLSGLDYDVLVLERQNDFYERKKSTGGTFPQTMIDFSVPPEDVSMHQTDKVVLESPENETVLSQTGYVLEFGDFKKYLAQDAENNGAEVEMGANVFEVIEDAGGEAEGVKYSQDGEIFDVSGDILVDATGPEARLAQELGVRNPDRDYHAVGLEYEIDGIDMNNTGHMMLRLGNDYAPGGYSWIFHTGGDSAKVGVCFLDEQAEETIQHYMNKFVREDERFSEEDIIENGRIDQSKDNVGERHSGEAYIDVPEQFVTDNFMAVGDTVSSVDPIWGEGIYKCMKSGREAAKVATDALENANTSEQVLEEYGDLWKDEVAPRRKRRQFMTMLMYHPDDDQRYDRFVEDIQGLEIETLRKLNKGAIPETLSLAEFGDIKPAAEIFWENFIGQER